MGKLSGTYRGILLSHKKNESLPLAATRMILEDVMLSEISGENLKDKGERRVSLSEKEAGGR